MEQGELSVNYESIPMKIQHSQLRHQACRLKWKGKNFQQENTREISDVASGSSTKPEK